MLYYGSGSKNSVFSDEDIRRSLTEILDKIGGRNSVIAVPPDITRLHSRAGDLTHMAWEYYGSRMKAVLPALGTHSPMNAVQLRTMFGDIPGELFRVHNWRTDPVTIGTVPEEFVREVSEGKVSFDWPAQVNKLLVEGEYDLILSVGQVVPHEVIGMASYNKNIFVGTGGRDGINKSHFLGAAYGMERIMGRADTPVRRILNYASDHFARDIPIVYIHTVVGMDQDGSLVTRGLYAGDDYECFSLAAELSLKVNFQLLDKPLPKVVVYLDPAEYKSTWLGNKSVYRTRMAIADGGELIVLAPGLKEFGEDGDIDKLIRKYGYVGTENVLERVDKGGDLVENLSAAAHLIHGSSEGRFSITYCPGHLSQEEIESVNFRYMPLEDAMEKYSPDSLKDGHNTLPGGEEIYFISNPAVGLWAYRERFGEEIQ